MHRAEQSVAADRAGTTVFRGLKFAKPARLLNFIVRPETTWQEKSLVRGKWSVFCVAVAALVGVGAFVTQRPKPQYCWLTFGPEAKVRVLVCAEGNALSVDRDGDGKFDGPGERFHSLEACKQVVIGDRDNKTSYILVAVADLHLVNPVRGIDVTVDIKGPVAYRQDAAIQLSSDAPKAPTAHFHGPLKLEPAKTLRVEARELVWKPEPKTVLEKGDKPKELFVTIAGANPGPGAQVVVCTSDPKLAESPFPKGLHPFADIEFPARKAGDPPLRKRYPLDKFC